MLVLSRKLGEKVVVPAHDLIIKVLEIRGNKVRLGIAAPNDTEVFRHEVWERLHGFREEGELVHAGHEDEDRIPVQYGGAEESMSDEMDITEVITELTKPWRGPLLHFSGPVGDDKVAAAEGDLGVRFPPSYRAFLRRFGSGRVHFYRLLGIGCEEARGDVVAVNHIALPWTLPHLVRVAETPVEHFFYLDTSERGPDDECPVRVYGPETMGRFFASSFLAFLRRICSGLVPSRREPAALVSGRMADQPAAAGS